MCLLGVHCILTVLLDSRYDSVVEQSDVCEILVISELVSN
jgi:hypothetical protein